MMRLALLVNRHSGYFRSNDCASSVTAIESILGGSGHQVETVITTGETMSDQIKALAARRDLDAVVVGGGDGTALAAIRGGIGRKRPLGLLPMGTVNLLARDLNLPLDPKAAARLVADAQPEAIDLAEVNGEVFAVWATLGIHPRMVHDRNQFQKGGMGRLKASSFALLKALSRYPMVKAELTVGGEGFAVRTPLIVVTNNAWRREPIPPARRALDEGLLEIHVVRCSSRLGLIGLALSLLVGRWPKGGLLETHSATELRVTEKRSRSILSLDGEVTAVHSPLNFRCLPKALLVLMPKAADGLEPEPPS